MERERDGEEERAGLPDDFYARGLPDGGGDVGGEPGDEVEALRAMLIAELRRRPGDMSALMRKAETVSRIMVAEKRLSPKKRGELSASLRAVFDQFKEIMPGPDDPEK